MMNNMKTKVTNKTEVTAKISEETIRETLTLEFLQNSEMCDQEGKPLPGVTVTCNRGPGRAQGYVLKATMDHVRHGQLTKKLPAQKGPEE